MPTTSTRTPPTADTSVIVARFGNASEAELARAVLASHGIDAFVLGEDAAITLSYIGPALGGVELRVRAADADRARRILQRAHRRDASGESALRRCPRCGTAVERQFAVCWNCGGTMEAAQPAEPPPVLPELDGSSSTAADTFDEQMGRCLRLAAWGVLLPPLSVVALGELAGLLAKNGGRALRDGRSYAALALCGVTLVGWAAVLWP
ncbi:MAG: hypothetical protein D6725_04645 [Planctomycetota bacterium]|nr:MAG: hypothetical protein D6725_04645 [Planctomycetota bacterium]